MHPTQIQLVQSSFARVEPIADTAAMLFYTRLFELDPRLRLMFKGNMVEQGEKLMTTLKVVVRGLTRLESLVPAVQALGRRHAGYGVADEHYDTVAEALLWTLQQGSGE
jgi:hemoglobin-like flavoprotein